MEHVINRRIFNYLFVAFSCYVTFSGIYTLLGVVSTFWNLFYYINETLLVINLLVVCCLLVLSPRIRRFACIAIGFKLIIVLYDLSIMCGVESSARFWEVLIILYYITSLIYYYVSSKRISK